MKIAGMVISIIAGVLALIIGVMAASLMSGMAAIASEIDAEGASQFAITGTLFSVLMVGVPLMCIVGGALAIAKPVVAVVLTAIPGVILIALNLTGQGANGVLIFIALGMLVGSLFIFLGHRKDSAVPAVPSA